MQRRIIPTLLTIALLVSSLLSILTIHSLQGNARIINYTGVVRGATQRLVKQELHGEPNDKLFQRLDGILTELASGKGKNSLECLDDDDYQELIDQMQTQWDSLKDEIRAVRQGANGTRLYTLSENYFSLADQAVLAAEIYAEKQVQQAELILIVFGAVFLLLAALLAWIQSRRQKVLIQAEESNRVESEKLEQMSQDLRAPMDQVSELMYIADPITYELLYINEAGRKTFGITELSGQKCYTALQGKDAPCDFCTTSFLKSGENYTWETTNPHTNRHYLLNDRLIPWEGRSARLEIAFDITETEAEKQSLKTALDAESMIMACVRTLYREQDIGKSIPAVLKDLGIFLAADRAYLATVRDNLLYNDYEWCRDGVSPQQEMLQALPMSSIESWQPAFSRQECVILEDLEELRQTYPEEYQLLHGQGIHSLVAAPMELDGQLFGLVGVDNPPPERIRSIASLLQTLCYFLMLAYRRTEDEQKLYHLSYYDTLTSFYNRNRYMEDCSRLSDMSGPMGVVYLDINGLKDINDQKGHAFGDQVLAECARQMREVFQAADFYRIGGDEFVIICLNLDRDTFEYQVSILRSRFRNGGLCRAAIGSQWTTQYQDIQQLVADADAQMYEDKKDFYRKNPASKRYRHHSDEVLRLSDPEILREEILQDRFVVYLQPKVSFQGSAVGAEALIRYYSRSGSLVLPGNFLPLLEESQTVSQIDFYVFEQICVQLQEWQKRGVRTLPISVNFSRCSLSQPDFVAQLSALCQKYGVEKHCLEVELTETAQVADFLDLQNLIQALRQEGFLVSIDDFGTEYANLALLSKVDFDVLKLDKSLIDDVANNAKARTVVETIIGICRRMHIEVVAEGIETVEQLDVLRACGVELVQGFLFSKPIPIGEYEKKYL